MRGKGSVARKGTSDYVPVVLSVIAAAFVFSVALSACPALPILGDPVHYHMTAQRLLRERVYAYGPAEPGTAVEPNAVVTPGYPTFLAAVYAANDSRSIDAKASAASVNPAVLTVQYLLALCTVGLIATTGLIFGGRWLSAVAGAMAAAYVPFAWASSIALGESLGTMLAALQLLLAVLMVQRKQRPPIAVFIAFGVTSGALAMVRPIMLLWALVPLAYLAMRRIEPPRRLLRLGLAVLLGLSVVLGPWVARNGLVLHRFVPLSENTGVVLFLLTGGGELSAQEQHVMDRAESDGDDGLAAVGRWRLKEAFEEDPAGFFASRASTMWEAIGRPWSPTADVYWALQATPDIDRIGEEAMPPPSKAFIGWMEFARWYHLGLLALCLLASLLTVRSPRLALVISVPLYVIALHAMTLFIDRYFLPAMPAVIVSAASLAYFLAVRGRTMVAARA